MEYCPQFEDAICHWLRVSLCIPIESFKGIPSPKLKIRTQRWIDLLQTSQLL